MKDSPDPGTELSRSISVFLISDYSVSAAEDKLDGDHFVASRKIVKENLRIQSHAFVESGYSGFAFIYETFARHHKFPFYPLNIPRTLQVIDGRLIFPEKLLSLVISH